MDNAPKDWQILKLNSFAGKMHTNLYTFWDSFKLKLPEHVRPKNKKWMSEILSADYCANGYLINNKSAKLLMERLYHHNKYELSNKYPHVSDTLIFKELKTYIYKYPFFTYNNKLASYNTKKQYFLDVYKHKFTTKMYKKMSKTRKNKL